MRIIISLIVFNVLYANTLENKNIVKVSRGNNHVVIQKGQQIKINNDKRKLFFQGYNPVSNTITVKDISYKVFYTKRKKLEYNLNEIDKIQLRVDDTFKQAILLWYPNVFVHVMPQALVAGLIIGVAGGIYIGITGEKDIDPSKGALSFIFSPMMIYIMGNGFINSWPTAKKYGKGEWLPIPLQGSNAWEIEHE
jgi:hypothetical protein